MKAGRKRSYSSYKNQYRAKERKLAANGVQMHQQMLTEEQFEAQYNRMLNKRQKEVTKGLRKTTGNITRDLVEKQAFALSAKQASAIKKAKPELSTYEIRSGGDIYIRDKFEEAVSEYLSNINPEGTRKEAEEFAQGIVNTEFFGS